MEFFHKTVLLEETINNLNIKPAGVYVDCTLGAGGCAKKIVDNLSADGKLIGLDCDPEAIDHCKERFRSFKNVHIIKSNFKNLKGVLEELNIDKIDGAVFDLGVSSYQLDNPNRGFSYKNDGIINMRMDEFGKTAKDFLKTVDFKELKKIIWQYGEERFADKIAKAIVFEQQKNEISTTVQLANIIKNAIPQKFRQKKGHPAKKTFQAIRIHLNSELINLKKALNEILPFFNSFGRLCVISFHSLEDRIVKTKMLEWSKSCVCPSDFPVCVCKNLSKMVVVTKKAIVPSAKEVQENPRSRSAKLRVCERI